MLRILFVDHEIRLSGGERDLVDLVRALPDGVETFCALPEPGPLSAALEAHGVGVHTFRMRPSLRNVSRWELSRGPLAVASRLAGSVESAVSLALLIRRLRPDIVHTNSMKAHLLALLPSRLQGAVLVWHVRDILESGWLARAFGWAARVGPARVICLSEAASRQFRSAAIRERTRTVYNGIRLDPVSENAVSEFRRAAGAGSDQFLVGMVGQIARWKGQDLFVEAAGKLAVRHPDMRFVIVGECLFPANEAGFAAAVRARAEELGLRDRLCWAGWFDQIEPVMHGLDLLVHQSRLPEPFGRVIVEALAAGTPVVASGRGAGPELVTPSVGRVVEPEDVDGLVAAIEDLRQRSRTEPGLPAAARQRAGQFDVSRTAEAVMAVWSEVSGNS